MRGGGGRGDVMGGMFPHLDMVTPIGKNKIISFSTFGKFGLRFLARGRTAQDGDCD